MLDVNTYFDGKVKSIAFKSSDLPSTVGVMQAGDYTFGTNQHETVTVISGALTVQLPDAEAWNTYVAGDTFEVAANKKFKLKVAVDTAYLCVYRDA